MMVDKHFYCSESFCI